MVTRSKVALAALLVITVMLLAFQTPLLARARGWTWDIWINQIASVFRIGPLNVSDDVLSQLMTLQADNVRLRAEQKEYFTIKEQLGNPSFAAYRTIPAEIAARPSDTFQVQYVINKGARDGITLGAPVAVYGSTLVGFITELNESTALFQLLTHPTTNLAAEVLSENTPKGLLIGQRYTTLKLTTIPRDALIATKQDVVTIAREGLPGGMLIGKIGQIHRDVNEAYQEANVEIPYDSDALSVIQVIVEP